MPGLYQGDDYDLAGFAVGAAERQQPAAVGRRTRPSRARPCQFTGVHSNGFSLVRQIVAGPAMSAWDDPAPFAAGPHPGAGADGADPDLREIRCWPCTAPGCCAARRTSRAAALPGNLPRALPHGTRACWTSPVGRVPPVMDWLAQRGSVAPDEMLRVFNCGIGMALVVEDSIAATELLEEHGETVFTIGQIEAAPGAQRHHPVSRTRVAVLMQRARQQHGRPAGRGIRRIRAFPRPSSPWWCPTSRMPLALDRARASDVPAVVPSTTARSAGTGRRMSAPSRPSSLAHRDRAGLPRRLHAAADALVRRPLGGRMLNIHPSASCRHFPGLRHA